MPPHGLAGIHDSATASQVAEWQRGRLEKSRVVPECRASGVGGLDVGDSDIEGPQVHDGTMLPRGVEAWY